MFQLTFYISYYYNIPFCVHGVISYQVVFASHKILIHKNLFCVFCLLFLFMNTFVTLYLAFGYCLSTQQQIFLKHVFLFNSIIWFKMISDCWWGITWERTEQLLVLAMFRSNYQDGFRILYKGGRTWPF